MDAKDLIIRRMTKDELVLALDWAADEGWNPGLFDAESFHAADPDGFLLGELDGEPIGSVSAVRYGTEFGSWVSISSSPPIGDRATASDSGGPRWIVSAPAT